MSLVYYVEDDADIRNLVTYTLGMTGFEAAGFECAPPFEKALQKKLPDLILLDVMLPGESGFDLLRRLRSNPETAAIPVMIITARDEEDDKVGGLDLGADDYVSKPFGVMELIARIKALLRRCAAPEDERILRCGAIVMDTTRHTVESCGVPLQLTLKEYALLQQLLEAAGRLVEREKLIEQVWGAHYTGANHTLDAHIRTLRSKLGEPGSCIQTVYGRGYRLRMPENNE